MRQWFALFNEDHPDDPVEPCPSLEFSLPAEGDGRAFLVVFDGDKPTATGIERTDTGDFIVSLALRSWQLDAGSLSALVQHSTDKRLMVTVRLASGTDANESPSLLDLIVC